MAKETKLKKNIMKKIKGFTPPKYTIGDIVIIDAEDRIFQGLIIGADYKRKTWNYYVEFAKWFFGEVKTDKYIWEENEIITTIIKK